MFARRRSAWLWPLLGAAFGATIAGCDRRDTPAAQVEPGATAGAVVEISGSVTATRAGASRTLATGDSVSGDDVIATGDAGRVVIELAHNGVRWSLGPGKEKQVSASAAWTAARATGQTAITDERSGAAGRHAEREAADTSASAPAAAAPPSVEPETEAAEGAEMATQRAKPAADRRSAPPLAVPAAPVEAAKAARRGESEAPSLMSNDSAPPAAAMREAAPGGGAQPVDPPSATLDRLAPAPAATSRRAIRGAAVPSLSRTQIERLLAPHRAAIRACNDLGEAITVEIVLHVRADGRVERVEIDGPEALAALRSCVSNELRAASLRGVTEPHDGRYRLVIPAK